MKRNKQGVSLIVLVITMMVPYYETLKASKIGKDPLENKIETMINAHKVTEIKAVTFNFCKTIV